MPEFDEGVMHDFLEVTGNSCTTPSRCSVCGELFKSESDNTYCVECGGLTAFERHMVRIGKNTQVSMESIGSKLQLMGYALDRTLTMLDRVAVSIDSLNTDVSRKLERLADAIDGMSINSEVNVSPDVSVELLLPRELEKCIETHGAIPVRIDKIVDDVDVVVRKQ